MNPDDPGKLPCPNPDCNRGRVTIKAGGAPDGKDETLVCPVCTGYSFIDADDAAANLPINGYSALKILDALADAAQIERLKALGWDVKQLEEGARKSCGLPPKETQKGHTQHGNYGV